MNEIIFNIAFLYFLQHVCFTTAMIEGLYCGMDNCYEGKSHIGGFSFFIFQIFPKLSNF